MIFASIGNMNGQMQAFGLDWRYWTNNSFEQKQWQNTLYKYKESGEKQFLRQSYIVNYILQDVEEQKRFETFLFAPLHDYKVETYKFEAKFRVPIFPLIWYYPQFYTQRELDEYQELMNSTSFSNQLADEFTNRYFLTEARDTYIFSHPNQIKLSWDSIPDAPQIGLGGFLSRRSARDGINMLLRDNDFDTHPSLEKIKFTSGPWTLKGTENILVAQGYVNNWVKGGESSISLGSDLRLIANYKKDKNEWDSYIIHKVGIISTENDPSRVNTDLIEINTKYGLKASDKWYYSFLYNFKTQFFNAYDKDEILLSGFLAPAYMSFALGMDFKHKDKFTLLLSPITSRVTLVADTSKYDQTKFGIDPDKSIDIVNGISVVNNFAYQLSQEFKISSRFDAFYQFLGKVKEGKDRQVQIDWEVILDMRINRYLSTRILAHARYFTNESSKIQFRENFMITFSYNF
ncbi:DUF3078 domain-containing protein [Carboxylicivirga sp. M1479]|uniref:DUF3078 domain-containing protein n=1 Tax=Carboxylicivirga sp. M1479 TaxID=2594476 RepID=UPI00163DB041|nr:DUF3078 domain-containing protein [Carboxylicivirga sp. M1479]